MFYTVVGGGLERCSVTMATHEGQSAACVSLTKEDRGTDSRGERERKVTVFVCVGLCVCEQETHHLQSP